MYESDTKVVAAKCEIFESDLETVLPAGRAALEVKQFKTTAPKDYSDAILGKSSFGGDVAEIYFYRFAPKGSPHPSELKEFEALIADPEKKANYDNACYEGWLHEIKLVQGVVEKYGGKIQIDGNSLDTFIEQISASGKTPVHRLHVQISVAGQEELAQVRKIKNYVERLER